MCAIAAMYNPLLYYSRQMYRDFCCLTEETQNTVLKYLQLDLVVHEDDLFYDHCLSVLRSIVRDHFPKDRISSMTTENICFIPLITIHPK